MSLKLVNLGRLSWFACLLLLPFSAKAQSESILDYHSDVQVHDDGRMEVRETIRVRSAGDRIRHGIYRDFLTRYTDRLGNRYVVGFEVLAATRDRALENWHVQDLSNGKRVYLGRSDYLLPPGEHTYSISYTTTRELGFFDDHDELFWNVTGNGWIFAIEHASAIVRLPKSISVDQVHLDGFTGPQGSTARELSTAKQSDGSVAFEAEHPLGAFQGLTVLLTWPKGYVTAPTPEEKLRYFIEDNSDAALAAGGLAVIVLYYLVVWFLVGRDPAPGTIVALYEPPPGISPAAMRYLVRMGYDDKTFASAVLDMAVKGYVQIREQAGSYALNRTKLSPQALSPEETAADTLFNGCASIWLHDENHTQISAAIRAMKAWLKNAEYKIYFLTNGRYMLPAILVSIAMQTGIVLLQAPQKMILAAVLTVWLTAWSFGVAAMLLVAIRLWKSAFEGGEVKSALKTQAIAITAISIPVLGFEAVGLYILATSTSVVVVFTLLVSVLVHVFFHQLLKAPTKAGRNVLDKIEGFKRFLSAVDGDRMNRLGLPANTPEVFEKYLPYALALDVEHAWAERFSGVLNGATQAPGQNSAGYSPSWYSGSAWSSLGAAGFANSLGSSFSQAIASSSSAPGSTSGGSGNGGGSGGGGGGGGGGGW